MWNDTSVTSAPPDMSMTESEYITMDVGKNKPNQPSYDAGSINTSAFGISHNRPRFNETNENNVQPFEKEDQKEEEQKETPVSLENLVIKQPEERLTIKDPFQPNPVKKEDEEDSSENDFCLDDEQLTIRHPPTMQKPNVSAVHKSQQNPFTEVKNKEDL